MIPITEQQAHDKALGTFIHILMAVSNENGKKGDEAWQGCCDWAIHNLLSIQNNPKKWLKEYKESTEPEPYYTDNQKQIEDM